MCLAVPARVVAVDGRCARVDFGGVSHELLLDLVGEVRVGDYVLAHAGYAIQVLDEEVARETLELFEELHALQAELDGEEPAGGEP